MEGTLGDIALVFALISITAFGAVMLVGLHAALTE